MSDSPLDLLSKFSNDDLDILDMPFDVDAKLPSFTAASDVPEQAVAAHSPVFTNNNATGDALGPFTKPSAIFCHKASGLVHGYVRFSPRTRFQPATATFCLQDANNNEDVSFYLTARKQKNRVYCIYNATKENEQEWELLATLERREFHNDCVSFALTTTADQTLDACVFFNKPRLIQYAFHGAPRQMEFGVFTEEGRNLTFEQAIQVVKDCCKYSESNAASSAYKIVGDSRYMCIFQSVVPYKKPGHKQFGLNFHGRGRGASNKNCQMHNSDGDIAIQMAKFEKNGYHVDYNAPLNAVQAFGFALAQLDL
jgi:hypothetical protein